MSFVMPLSLISTRSGQTARDLLFAAREEIGGRGRPAYCIYLFGGALGVNAYDADTETAETGTVKTAAQISQWAV